MMIFCLNPERDDKITEEVLLHCFSFQSKCIEKFHAHADLFYELENVMCLASFAILHFSHNKVSDYKVYLVKSILDVVK